MLATVASTFVPRAARADDLHWSGASPCTLVEGIPGEAHPVRRAPSIANAVSLLDKAGWDRAKNGKAYDAFVKSLDGLYGQAEKAFAVPDTKSKRAFQPAAAQRFLSAHVLAANAPLRVGLDRFEPSPEVAAMMVLAACRAERGDQALELARSLTQPETVALRAFGVLLLLDRGTKDAAAELAAQGKGLGEDGFLAVYVRADLAPTRDEQIALHALAARRQHNGDQELAWRLQHIRLGLP